MLERLAQPGARERDGQLVAGEQGDPQAVVVERAARPAARPATAARRCSVAERRRLGAPGRVGRPGPQRVDVRDVRRARVAVRSPVAVTERDGPLVGAADPERAAGRVGQPDELQQDGPASSAERPARRDRAG